MASKSSDLFIKRVVCKNFRCFSYLDLTFDHPLLICQDSNGAGKTSLVEALHYACYLRSFRTHVPRELVQFGHEGFCVQLDITRSTDSFVQQGQLQVGFSDGQRLIKLDDRPIQSHNELLDWYRVVTLTHEDIRIITGGPDERRLFIDIVVALSHDTYRVHLRSLRHIVDQRNAFLQSTISSNNTMYEILTEQLMSASREIQQHRMAQLVRCEQWVNNFLQQHLSALSIQIAYQKKRISDGQLSDRQRLYDEERRMGRSLFGAHVDDFSITLNEKKSRVYASRGQQKLIAFLLKLAHLNELLVQRGPAIVLLDDFLTDFDEQISQSIMNYLIRMGRQIVVTMPTADNPVSILLNAQGAQSIRLRP